jgi:hypothetical protein
MKEPSDNDILITLPEVGEFVFSGRRTIGDRLKLRAEYTRLAGLDRPIGPNGEEDPELWVLGNAIAHIKVLAVRVPKGWDDPEALTDDTDKIVKLAELWTLLQEKLLFFRRADEPRSEAEGAGTVEDQAVLVSETV